MHPKPKTQCRRSRSISRDAAQTRINAQGADLPVALFQLGRAFRRHSHSYFTTESPAVHPVCAGRAGGVEVESALMKISSWQVAPAESAAKPSLCRSSWLSICLGANLTIPPCALRRRVGHISPRHAEAI